MDAKMRPLAWGLLLFGTAIVCAIKAAGQDLSALLPPGVPGFASWIDAQKNPDPAWQPLGLPAGTFTLFPEVAASTGYDSNILATNPAAGSALLGTHAQLLAKSNWQTDQLGAFTSIDNLLTPGEPNQGRTDWTASMGGVKQFRDDALTLGFAHFSAHEDRTALDALRPMRRSPTASERIGHIALYVRDLERSARFYTQVFAFRAVLVQRLARFRRLHSGRPVDWCAGSTHYGYS
jgi:hypothetical protein